jgi:hypothetical protein
MKTSNIQGWLQATLCGLALAAALTSTGCQVTEAGQTLPSPWYLDDDVQYFPAGPEFKLSREAAALKAFKAERELERMRGN